MTRRSTRSPKPERPASAYQHQKYQGSADGDRAASIRFEQSEKDPHLEPVPAIIVIIGEHGSHLATSEQVLSPRD